MGQSEYRIAASAPIPGPIRAAQQPIGVVDQSEHYVIDSGFRMDQSEKLKIRS